MTRNLAVVSAAATLLASACGGSGADRFDVSVAPETANLDTPFDIRVSGADDGEPVTITASARSRAGRIWRTTLRVRANDDGKAELRRQYLLARLQPVAPVAEGDYLPWEQDLTVTASDGHNSATAHARRSVRAESVRVDDVRPTTSGFYGRWWQPREDARQTAVVLLGGSNGGLPGDLIPGVLAQHGYSVLAVAYFGVAGVPRDLLRIPLEYFRAPLEWVRRQRGVDPDRVVVFGISRGGELALILSSIYPDLVDAVVAYVPSSIVVSAIVDPTQPAWTLRGRPYREGGPIPVERISEPIFVVGGGQDALWPSGMYVEEIGERLERQGRRDFVALVYPEAGHSVGVAVPNLRTRTSIKSRYGELYFGGSPAADERARQDSWPRLLEFLDRL